MGVIGENIKYIRLKRGLTQKELGDLCEPKMADSAIRRYENGNITPKPETLKRIARALCVYWPNLLDPKIQNSKDIAMHENNKKGKDIFLKFALACDNEFLIKSYLNGVQTKIESEKIYGSDTQEAIAYELLKEIEFEKEFISKNEIKSKLYALYEKLNEKGQAKAIEQVEMLTKIPEYQAPAASDPADQTPDQEGSEEK